MSQINFIVHGWELFLKDSTLSHNLEIERERYTVFSYIGS